MKNVVSLDVTLLFQLLVTANVVPSSLNFGTLMMEAIRSSEMSLLTRVTRCNISEDSILQVFLLFAKWPAILGLSNFYILLLQKSVSLLVNRQEREAGLSSLYSSKVKNA
jgi:hypothetical protein